MNCALKKKLDPRYISLMETIHSFTHSLMHPAVCFTAGPKSLPK